MDRPETPELHKIRAVKDESQKIGAFLDWLNERGILLCEEVEGFYKSLGPTGEPVSKGLEIVLITKGTERLLADYFEIDLNKVEEERRALLDHQRKLNGDGE